MPVRLTYRAGMISGFINGRALNCPVHSEQPGNLPAPGEYYIGATTNDLIYGPVAVMLRAGLDPGVAQECVRRLPGTGANTLLSPPVGMIVASGVAGMTKQERPGTAAMFVGSAPVPSGAVFVLATRPMAGQNCLLALPSSGLFEALGAGGGVSITVY